MRMCRSGHSSACDFRPIHAPRLLCHCRAMTQTRILGIAGLTAWLMVGLPVVIQGASSPGVMLRWAIAYVLFGALFVAGLKQPRLSLLAMEALCVVVMVLLLCDGFEGALLVMIAMRLPSLVDRKAGLLWIAVQTLLLPGPVAIHWNGRAAFLLTPPYLGFQILAF